MATRIVVFTLLSLTLCCYGARGACQEDETSVFDAQCRETIFAPSHIFSPDWGVLHDSRDQTNLLGMPIAQYRARDVDGVGGVNWFTRGSVCQQELRVCSNALTEAEKNQQNNWVFSSHIRFPDVPGVDGVQEVFFNITYRFVECVQRPDCQRTYVTAYKYDVDAPDENSQTDPSRYSPLRGTEELSRIVQSEQFDAADSVIGFSIPRPRTNGFYLAFRDQGTCGQVRRVILYYERTLQYNGTLLTCPTVPYPLQGTATTTQGSCCCGENAANNASLNIVCSADQRCVEPMSGVCGCAPGYTFNVDTQACDPCPAGMFQPDISLESKCEMCPDNSRAVFPASGVCNCTGDTIRNKARPRDPCAEPPSSPQLLASKPTVDGTFVTVCWGPALNSGGLDDLHYNVYVRQVDQAVYTKVNNEGIFSSESKICHEVSGLDAMTSYAVVVVSANGATGDPETLDQQLTSVQGHFVAYFVDTGEAGLRHSEALALTFFLTLIFVAAITAVIVFLIMWFVCVKRNVTMGTSPKTNTKAEELTDVHVTNNTYKNTESTTKTTPLSRPRPPRPPIKPRV